MTFEVHETTKGFIWNKGKTAMHLPHNVAFFRCACVSHSTSLHEHVFVCFFSPNGASALNWPPNATRSASVVLWATSVDKQRQPGSFKAVGWHFWLSIFKALFAFVVPLWVWLYIFSKGLQLSGNIVQNLGAISKHFFQKGCTMSCLFLCHYLEMYLVHYYLMLCIFGYDSWWCPYFQLHSVIPRCQPVAVTWWWEIYCVPSFSSTCLPLLSFLHPPHTSASL